MSFLRPFSCRCLVLVASLCFINGASAQSETKSDADPTIKSLLNEVRLLRQTLQNTGLNAYRSQILLERIKINNEQIVRLSSALGDTRATLEKTESTIPRMGEQVKLLETMVESEMDAVKRAQLDFEIKDIKRSVEVYKGQVGQLKEREQEQAAQLRMEQSKLAELERRLENLENQIENEIQGLKSEPKQP
jgi:predicted  nucleic acid-binding Zn-ribbon protein